MSWAAIGCSLTGLVLLDCCPKHATSSVAVAFPDALAGHAAARDMGGTARGAAGRLADGGGARMQGAADAVHSDAGRPAALPARHRARGRGAARTRGAAGRHSICQARIRSSRARASTLGYQSHAGRTPHRPTDVQVDRWPGWHAGW